MKKVKEEKVKFTVYIPTIETHGGCKQPILSFSRHNSAATRRIYFENQIKYNKNSKFPAAVDWVAPEINTQSP